MRRLTLLLAMLTLLAGWGCAHRAGGISERDEFGPMAGAIADAGSPLLFDRRPGPYRASDFAFRSDWPSTNAYYSPGETIFYNQRFIDYQRPLFGEPGGWTYRRAESQRVSIGFR